MDHRLVAAIEKALDWTGPDALGREFTRGALPERDLCARLLTPTRLLDLVMRRSLAPHRLQILVDGEFLHPHHYLTTATARRGQTPMADMRRLGELLRSGCTLVVDELNTYDPTMEVACRALQWWSHELVQVNTYLTTGEAAGFKLHWMTTTCSSCNWPARSRGKYAAAADQRRCTATPHPISTRPARCCGPARCAPGRSCTSRAAAGIRPPDRNGATATACTSPSA